MAMARKIRTTVVVTAAAEAVLQKYRNNFGLKGPLSVGLMLFDQLSPQEKIDKTAEVENADRDPKDLLALLRDLVAVVPESAIAALTPTEAEAIRRYQQTLASENAAQRDEAGAAASREKAKRARTRGR